MSKAISRAIRLVRKDDGGPVSTATTDQYQSTKDSVSQQYPALQPYVNNLSIQSGTPSGPNDDRQLEFYQPWESDNPVPGKLTTQIYNQNLQGQDLTDTVAGDMLHHLGTINPSTNQPVDPTWMSLKQQLISAMGPDQKSMDQEAYQQEKTNPSYQTGSYDDWMKNNRADAYIRGALFPKLNPEWQEEGIYTPQMKAITQKMQQYLKQQQSTSGGGMMRGGGVSKALRAAKANGGGVFSGYIPGTTGGRTDNKPISVADGSFVIPADVISGLGEGNSHAGALALHKQFRMDVPTKADGGAIGQPIPIVAASGEMVIPPDKVADIGGGDLDRGHGILDSLVKHVRSKTIKKLKSLPAPKRN